MKKLFILIFATLSLPITSFAMVDSDVSVADMGTTLGDVA